MKNQFEKSIYDLLYLSSESGVPMLLLSNPGIGKTTVVNQFAYENGMKMTKILGSSSSSEDILGIFVNEGENHTTLRKKAPEWYMKIIDDEGSYQHLLFVDELTTVNEFVQGALLTLIFDRKIEGFPELPKDTLIVAAGNYKGNLSNNFGLISPILNRFCVINLHPTKDVGITRGDAYRKEIEKYVETYINVRPPSLEKGINDFVYHSCPVVSLDEDDHKRIEEEVRKIFIDMFMRYSKDTIKMNPNNDGATILSPNNYELSHIGRSNGAIYGIISGRTMHYLHKLIIAAITLGIESCEDYLFGCIGFGTGNFLVEEELSDFHIYLKDKVCGDINELLTEIRDK